MKRIHWIINLLSFALLINGCVIFPGPCIDLADIHKKTAAIKEWFVDRNIGYQTIVDKYGMSQTLLATISEHGYTHKDECGNTYESIRFLTEYSTSLSSISFSVNVRGLELSTDEFYLALKASSDNDRHYKTAIYDFIPKKSRDKNVIINYLDKVALANKEYEGVLKIDFKYTHLANDITTVYYAKKNGIIRFEQKNGNVFEVK